MKKILIVDDKKEFRSTLSDALNSGKYEVEVAENGIRALEKMVSFEPDLVILDMLMPEMGGLEFLRELKGRGIKSNILISTQLAQMDDISNALGEGMSVGVRGYIIKSSQSLEMIVKEIEKTLSSL